MASNQTNDDGHNDPLQTQDGLTFVRTLNAGSLGIVELWRQPGITGKKFAVKIANNNLIDQEAAILSDLHEHDAPRIVGYHGTVESHPPSEDQSRLITEFCTKGDLAKVAGSFWYCNDDARRIPEGIIWKYTLETLDAVNYMHTSKASRGSQPADPNWRPILHNDIKPDNIFIAADGKVRLGDFGLASRLPPGVESIHKTAGTSHYFPPEFPNRSTASDIWALGATVHFLCTSEPVRDIRTKDTEGYTTDTEMTGTDQAGTGQTGTGEAGTGEAGTGEAGTDEADTDQTRRDCRPGTAPSQSVVMTSASGDSNKTITPARKSGDQASGHKPPEMLLLNIHDITAKPGDRQSNHDFRLANWPRLGTYSKTLKRFLDQMLTIDPSKRPDAQTLLDDMLNCIRQISGLCKEGETWDDAIARLPAIHPKSREELEAADALLRLSRGEE